MTTPTTVQVRLQLRADTAANWTTNDPVLLANELGRETDTGKIKIGNGSAAWSSLSYQPFGGQITNADIASNAEIAVSKLADGAARQLLQTAANGTDVEWASNIDIPGTLDVTGAATFDAAVTIQGDLTVNGTTTTIDTANLAVEDKNIEIGKVASPTDVTADGGGITLKGTTDKTINWVDATDAWTFSEHVNIASGKEYRINGVKVLDATSLGSGVTGSSLTSVGTIGTGVWQGTAISKTYLDATLISTGDTGTVTSTMIADGTIVNADVNASAAIAGTKISPDFGSQALTTTGLISANGKVSFPLGTDALPSLYPGTDTNTGIYSPGADQVAISTNGTGRLFVDASGNVGVGVAPSARLHSYATLSNSVVETLRLQNASDGLNAGTEAVFASNNVAHVKIQQLVTGATAGNRGSDCLFFTKADGGSISERLRITSDGKVGLGTSSPATLLHIQGAGNQTFRLQNTTGGSIASPQSSFIDFVGGSAEIRARIEAQDRRANVLGGFLNIGTANTSNTIVNAIHIDNAQRVGIGTTSPSQILSVGGTTGRIFTINQGTANKTIIDNDFALELRSNAGYQLIHNANNSSGSIAFQINSAERARIDSSGRLLVGTSTSRASYAGNLEIEGTTSAATVAVTRNSANTAPAYLFLGKSRSTSVGGNTIVASGDQLGDISFTGSDGSLPVIAASIRAIVDGNPGTNDMPGRLVFSTTADGASSPTERMRIDSSGSVNLGNLASTSTASKETTSYAFIATGTSTTTSSVGLESWANATSTRYHIAFTNSNGVVGTISTNASATAYNTSSDYRLKENVVPLTGAVDRLQQIPVHRFNFIADPDTVVDGFIAHEAQEIVPECVTGTKDEVDADGNPVYQGIDQSKLVPLLTAALQEAIGRIETLEAEVAALKAS
jgi:hypothetical protein